MKHKHAALIKAWADGATIQYCYTPGVWEDCINNQPKWNVEDEYRVKPELADLERYGVEVGDVWSTMNGYTLTVACASVGVEGFRHLAGGCFKKDILKTLLFRRGVVNKL